ncbi:S-adenosyl-L-methionine-dependent methyltransferase [Mollisia scopiformis]|uniref:S-adenosyl-L-methionine-dependent methyltransferase n=1 Tax=Mollisia scopiformis TaxID=149040 RepID=A0A194XUJ2_MOLSC|nr:S-adenosyl-L-methionine-dependent methyltransferase [Mollisia scopiformis]KUJ23806.1 S-adenosyl-L-methionine-dependent methyltransferase [Mollisia scopiformis]
MSEEAQAQPTTAAVESPRSSHPASSPRSPTEAVATAGTAIEAEEDDYANDSAYEGDSIASSTTSIGSSVLKYREENGRTYHAYKDGSYALPNDEVESDRLDMQHHEFQLMFNGKLFTAPVPETKVLHRVLDAGTGTGIWAIDFADDHPESSVLGVDLSPIQPSFIPPNVKFEVDDLEAPWTYTQKFDLIYGRMLMCSLNNYPRFFEQAFANLAPGGFVEMADPAWPIKLNDGEWPEDSALLQWANLWGEGMAKMGRSAECARLYKSQMEAAGFVSVTETTYIVPNNRWPKDKKLKEIGMWQCENIAGPDGGIEGLSAAVFTRVLGWSKLELDVLLAKAKAEHRNTKIHSYYEYLVVIGQKPEE